MMSKQCKKKDRNLKKIGDIRTKERKIKKLLDLLCD